MKTDTHFHSSSQGFVYSPPQSHPAPPPLLLKVEFVGCSGVRPHRISSELPGGNGGLFIFLFQKADACALSQPRREQIAFKLSNSLPVCCIWQSESFPKGLVHSDAVCVILLRDSASYAESGNYINRQLNEFFFLGVGGVGGGVWG